MKQPKRYKTFLEMLGDQPKCNTAIIYTNENGLSSISYAELIKRIEKYPIDNDKKSIGILCENNLETILAIFAYANAKKQIVLLNPLDDISLLQKQIDSADVDFLIGREELIKRLSCSASSKENNEGNILFFTSGTTSSNKAVVLTEESLCSSAYNGGMCLPLEESDTLLSILPLSHVFGFVCSLFWGLSFGAKVALGRGLRHIIDDGTYYKASVISLVPQIASFMAMNKIFNKELRLALIGAGPCSQKIIDLIKANNIQVSFGYGLTETSSGVALSVGDDPFAMKVCPDDKIVIADDDEILISSPTCMMKGYYKKVDDTNKVLYDGYLHTGDLGKIDENGLLHITGRKKDILVLSDGTKIYLPEYEEELMKYLSGADYAVNLIEEKIILFVYDERHQLNVEEKVKEFNYSKPRGQRISKIQYVETKLPRTQTGKIKRWALKI